MRNVMVPRSAWRWRPDVTKPAMAVAVLSRNWSSVCRSKTTAPSWILQTTKWAECDYCTGGYSKNSSLLRTRTILWYAHSAVQHLVLGLQLLLTILSSLHGHSIHMSPEEAAFLLTEKNSARQSHCEEELGGVYKNASQAAMWIRNTRVDTRLLDRVRVIIDDNHKRKVMKRRRGRKRRCIV
jgi:hypothetical protein